VDNVRIPPPLPIHNQPESATESLKLWLADRCCYGRIGKPQQRTLKALNDSFWETKVAVPPLRRGSFEASTQGTTVQGNWLSLALPLCRRAEHPSQQAEKHNSGSLFRQDESD
jgi:hypothetical protein